MIGGTKIDRGVNKNKIVYLYKDGNEYTDITGGWKAATGTVTKGSVYMTVQNYSFICTINEIDLTKYRRICFKFTATASSDYRDALFGIGDSYNGVLESKIEACRSDKPSVIVDITNYTSGDKPCIKTFGSSCKPKITEIWLEK